MAESDAIVNLLSLLTKSTNSLNEKVTESAERQSSAFKELEKALIVMRNVQSGHLKVAKNAEKAAKARHEKQVAAEEAAKEAAKAEKDAKANEAAAKQKQASIESIKGLGAIIKGQREVGEQKAAIGEKLKPGLDKYDKFFSSIEDKLTSFSKKADGTNATGMRRLGTKTAGMGAKGLGGVVKILKHLPKMFGPLATVALTIAKHFDKLQGAIGFLITGGIAILGTVIFGLKEKMKGLIEKFQPLIQYIKDLPGNLRILFTETLPAKFEEFTKAFSEIFGDLGSFFTNFPDTLLVFVEDAFSSISKVVSNIGESIANLFPGLTKFLMDEIVSILKNIPFIQKLIKDEEKKKSDILAEEEEVINRRNKQGTGITMKDGLYVGIKETTPQEMVDNKGVKNNNSTSQDTENQSVNILGEGFKMLGERLQEYNKVTQEATEAQKELSDNIKVKDMNTTIINNTAPAPTQSYSNGGKSRN